MTSAISWVPLQFRIVQGLMVNWLAMLVIFSIGVLNQLCMIMYTKIERTTLIFAAPVLKVVLKDVYGPGIPLSTNRTGRLIISGFRVSAKMLPRHFALQRQASCLQVTV